MISLNIIWHFDYVITGFLIALSVGFVISFGLRFRLSTISFLTGVIILFLCTSISSNTLRLKYPMSLHMLSHVAIILIAAPLLIWGIESDLNKKSIAGRFTTFLGRYPLISWITGTMTMWLWHVPYFFHLGMETADMTNPGNHLMGLFGYIHLTSLLSGGIIFWAPVLFIQTGSGLKPLETVLYLTTACISCSVLGLLITFAPPGMYISGMSMTGMSNISALRDQQVAGLIMWVPCCFVYLTVSMLILIEWMSEKNNRRSAMIEIQKQKLA